MQRAAGADKSGGDEAEEDSVLLGFVGEEVKQDEEVSGVLPHREGGSYVQLPEPRGQCLGPQ